MICLYYRWRISTALDSDKPHIALPHAHLRRCPSCRAFFEDSLRMASALQGLPVRLHAGRYAGEPSIRPIRGWKRAGWALAMAACLLLALIVSRLSPSHGPATANRAAPSRPAASNEPAFSTEQLLAQVRQPLEALGYPAGQPIVDQIEQAQRQILAAGRSMVACLPVQLLPRPDNTSN